VERFLTPTHFAVAGPGIPINERRLNCQQLKSRLGISRVSMTAASRSRRTTVS